MLLALCAVIVIYEIYKFPRRDSRVLEFDYSPPLDTVEPENMTESGRVCAVLAVGPRLVDGVSALCTYQGHLAEGAQSCFGLPKHVQALVDRSWSVVSTLGLR